MEGGPISICRRPGHFLEQCWDKSSSTSSKMNSFNDRFWMLAVSEASDPQVHLRCDGTGNSERQGCLVTCPIDIEKMKIKCGRTVYPIPVANPGSKIT